MNTIQFELGGGASLALPAHIVAQRLIESLQTAQQPPSAGRSRIGEYLTGQGGVYVGDIHGDDGVLYGLVTAQEEDIGSATWGPSGALDLSQWDGLSNTNALRESPAAKLASNYERDGHCDFYLPARRELMVALANVPHLFGKEGWYWSSTPRGDDYAWAVDFEYGRVLTSHRDYEFRVRPFRRFTH
ncbi:DUF1566 domain-containing protein [Pseudothauera rhizosphaerae]|uniref:DUF1566 domain-containing protein n=1 Tax=Pseudothauera rhizosphaerae TaxID=2565932 RepID=A0A4S4A844_9RHOO|nr:DUF1566 domain-containing protein [Pseudothauera rhizosphaerae]THF54660.1 DUF1566 domain-containing protein [Pseudothauera rhizosphaerae]